MNQQSKQIFSLGQQSKFQQLQLEVSALEEQLDGILKKQLKLREDYNLPAPISLIYVNERVAKTGIRLAHNTIN